MSIVRWRYVFIALTLLGVLGVSFAGSSRISAQESFSKLVGPVEVKPVSKSSTLQVPFITWGGDVATFHANGGLTTKPGTLFQRQGLKLKLVPGDDFPNQVRQYLSGESPFLRGTMRMLGQASEVLGSDPRTKPVVFLQLTWSAGDHMVARQELKTIDAAQLKGKKICLQQGGPHVGMLDDILRAAKVEWKDINVVWTSDLTGPNGPAARFVKDKSIDACLAISPDMIGLTGGLESKGSGAEGTVKGAHVLISTASMSRSIADVYACRKDFYDANKTTVEKFIAGYLKGCEELLAVKRQYEEKGASPPYMAALQLTQDIYGKDVIPTKEVDAHGLISDATFVGLPGNYSFFMDKGNLDGFLPKQKRALELAVGQGYAKVEAGFFPPNLDYDRLKSLGKLNQPVKIAGGGGVGESVDLFPENIEAENTILSFSINFEPNQKDFSEAVYGPEFQRAVENASTFGNAIVIIRGHADPTKTLVDMIKAGMAKGIVKRTGTRGNYKYFVNGKPLNLEATKDVSKLIEEGAFDGVRPSPRETMQAALNLSRARAEAVRDAIVAYAKRREYRLDAQQIQPVGVGVLEPLIAKPRNIEQAKQNMRVEFRLVKVPAEVAKSSDFDF